MLGSLGWQELLIILVILALIFGASRVAGLGRSLGQGIREFRSEVKRDDDPLTSPPAAPSAAAGTRTEEESRSG